MKKKIIFAILAMAIVMSVSACSNQPQAAPISQTYSQPDQPVQATAGTPAPQTTAATTKAVTLDDIGASFIGYALDDVVKAFKDANKSHLYSYESDNGKSIIVKNNWSVCDYYISGGKIVFVCTKFRNDGILDAAAENADGISAALDILTAF